MPPKSKKDEEKDSLTRIAVVNVERCKPKKCQLECKRACPVNAQGRLCIEVEHKSKISQISEELCIGCALCVKRCPYSAIQIINLPSNLDKQTTHRFGQNGFKLHRLPLPRPGRVLGLCGANGTGKSTALQILKGKLKPNLGNFREEPAWEDILRYFRGSEHQAYFQHLLEDHLRALIKPQFVDLVPRSVKGTVRKILAAQDERGQMDEFVRELDLTSVLDHDIATLSGGELQRFTIATMSLQKGDIYMFDEPSSYLDVKQRIKAARVIRGLVRPELHIIVVEHDLAVVDYMSDYVSVLYGKPGAFGVVTVPHSCREGINIYLDGFVPTENLRFREESLSFKIAEVVEDRSKRVSLYKYPAMKKTLQNEVGAFTLSVEEGSFSDSEIIVLLGENGCGKTTLIRLLAGHMEPDDPSQEVPSLNISYKPQMIAPKFEGTVRMLLQTKVNDALNHPQFQTDVLRPFNIQDLMDLEVQTLSGGELQRVGLTLALGKPADLYLIDEPSAYLDSDQRIIAARVIKRFVLHAKKTAFIVEHDFIMATYMADRVIVYDGTPSVACTANAPSSLLDGMNKFLRSLEITFRRDPSNYRPRINKLGSQKDKKQKRTGNYFYMNLDEEVKVQKHRTGQKRGQKHEEGAAASEPAGEDEETEEDTDDDE